MSDDILAQILARLTAIEAGQSGLRTDLIAARMDRLQASLDGIREDLTMTGGANDHTRRLGDNIREELRSLADLVAAMQRSLLKHGTRLDELEKRRP
jgi:hypothetical protein